MHRKFTSLLISAVMLISTFVLIVPTETDGEITLTEEWVATYDGPGNGNDFSGHIAVDATSGNVYISGHCFIEGTDRDFITISYDSYGNLRWIKRYNGPGNNRDEAYAMVLDPLENVYVTGPSYTSTENGYDYTTIKYDSDGNELWVARYNGYGNGYDSSYSITLDQIGNVIVTGKSFGMGTGYDYTTVSYFSSNGTQRWVARYNGPAIIEDVAYDITTDVKGNIFITGWSRGNGTGLDYATVAYNNNGEELWVARYDGPRNASDLAYDVITDSLGNVIISGGSSGIGTNRDIATIKYDSYGNELWVQRYNGPENGDDGAHSITSNPSGDIFVTGESEGDYITLKYDSFGNEIWAAIYNGPEDGGDQAWAICSDGSSGNIYVTGNSYGGNPIGDGSDYDYTIIAYDSSGNEIWVGRFNGLGNGRDISSDIALDSWGNVYVTGSSLGIETNRDIVTIKYTIDQSSVNPLPVADAGPDQTVYENDIVILDGSNSTGGSSSGYTPPSDMISWWPGDLNATDIVDGNHGTLLYGATYGAGTVDEAFKFDGKDDVVSVTDSESLKITGSISIDAWLNIQSFPSVRQGHGLILFRGDSRGALDPYYLSAQPGGYIRFHVESTTTRINLEAPISSNKWVFVAATLDDATGKMRIYIDGALAAETTTSIRPFAELNPSYQPGLGIGNHCPSSSHNMPFHGLIDEMELFDRTLTVTEIEGIYNAGSSGKQKTPGGQAEIISYEWDFESDGVFDYQETKTLAPDGSFDGITEHTFGDNGNFTATLRVTDENGEQATDICNITVLNVNPTLEFESAVMEVEIGLRVAGRKFNDVGMTLSENEKIVGYVSIERMPGSPDNQMAWIPMTLDMTKTYSATVTYTPEDPPNIGGNPVWIYVKFPNGSIQKIHHTFNVQQSKKRNSDHWNHIEPWEVDLNANLIGWVFELKYHITDPGSDDEALTCNYGSQNMIINHLCNPPDPDPYPSPEINPRDIMGSTTMIYEGPGTLSLQAEDDDTGSDSKIIHLA